MQESLIEKHPEKDLSWLKDADYNLVDTVEKLESMKQALEPFEILGLDTETTCISYMQGSLVGMSVSGEEGVGYYIPVRHTHGTNLPEDAYKGFLEWVKSSGKQTVWFNAKFDWHFITKDLGNDDFPFTHDTQVQLKLVYANDVFPSLKASSKMYFNVQMLDFLDNFKGASKKTANFATLDPKDAVSYAAADADFTLRLHNKFFSHKRVQAQKNIYDLEMELVPALGRQECMGIRLDLPQFQKDLDRLEGMLKDLEKHFYEITGIPSSSPADKIINSHQKLSDLIFNKMGIPVPTRTKKNKSGYYSTDKKVLKKIKNYPLIKVIQKWKKLFTLMSRTLTALPGRTSSDGKIHTSFGSVDAKTGRLNSSKIDPNLEEGTNLQQIAKPIEVEDSDEEDLKARSAFVADPGHYLVAIDFKQIEYRIAAGLSHETRIIEGFARGVDYHTLTASVIFSVPPEKVTEKQRDIAKTFNFGLNYGQSPAGLGLTLGIPLSEAQKLFDDYWAGVPNFYKWRREEISNARARGWTSTPFGRVRDMPGIKSSDRKERSFWERSVISTIIQGGAADVMKMKIVAVDKLCRNNPKITPISNIHDEMLIQVHESVPPKEVADFVVPTMLHHVDGWPELIVDLDYGPNWADMETLDLGYKEFTPTLSSEVEETEVRLPEDSTDDIAVSSFKSGGPTLKQACLITAETDDEKKFDVLSMVCGKFPGDYMLYLKVRGSFLETKFRVDPNLKFRDFVTRIFDDSSCLSVYNSSGGEEIPKVVVEEVQFT